MTLNIDKVNLIDCYELYNKQQRTFYSITIDTQSVDDYNKSHIKNALNIEIVENKNDDDYYYDIISKYQQNNSKDVITAIYFYTNDIKNDSFWNHISIITNTLIKHEICKKEHIFVLKDKYNVFCMKFPFLCNSNNNCFSNCSVPII